MVSTQFIRPSKQLGLLVNKSEKLQVLYEEYDNCQRCPELCKSRSQVVFGYGSQDAKIVAVAQAPGDTEDKTGLPLIGPTGRILDYFLAKAFQDRDDRLRKLIKDFKITKSFGNRTNFTWGQVDKTTGIHSSHWTTKQILAQWVFYTNSNLCYPEKDRAPTPVEMKNCKDRLFETIYTIDPHLLLIVGGVSLEAVLGKRGLSISTCKGKLMDLTFPGRQVEIKYPAMPIYHPSFLMRNPVMDEGSDWDITEKAVLKAVQLVDEYEATSR